MANKKAGAGLQPAPVVEVKNMDYIYDLTQSLISALSIGHSAPETVWFWLRAMIIYRFAIHVVNAFI